MGFLTTWAVDGSRTPAAVTRMATYAATSGAAGIVRPDHCKLLALGGLTVGLQPGAVLVRAGETGSAQWQTYEMVVELTDGDAVVTLSGPSSSSRTRYAVLVVPDPQWAGVPAPANPLTAVYAELRILTQGELGALTLPHYQVATLVIPANASVITQPMITDTRKMAAPTSEPALWAHRLDSGAPEDRLDDNAGVGEPWPDVFTDVEVPEWATTAHIVVTAAQVVFPGGSAFRGYLWHRLGTGPEAVNLAPSTIQHDAATSTRETLVAAGRVSIPAAMRGTTQRSQVWGRAASGARPSFTPGSSLAVQLMFKAEPV